MMNNKHHPVYETVHTSGAPGEGFILRGSRNETLAKRFVTTGVISTCETSEDKEADQ